MNVRDKIHAGDYNHYAVGYKVLSTGNLILTVNNQARHELAEGWRDHHDWDRQWYDIIGPFQENGMLYPVDPDDIAALTSAPILTDDLIVEADGSRHVLGRVWWFPDYMVRDPLEELRNTGRVEFTLCD